jgi:hypothetical protein
LAWATSNKALISSVFWDHVRTCSGWYTLEMMLADFDSFAWSKILWLKKATSYSWGMKWRW